jgi:hypothetical protein
MVWHPHLCKLWLLLNYDLKIIGKYVTYLKCQVQEGKQFYQNRNYPFNKTPIFIWISLQFLNEINISWIFLPFLGVISISRTDFFHSVIKKCIYYITILMGIYSWEGNIEPKTFYLIIDYILFKPSG